MTEREEFIQIFENDDFGYEFSRYNAMCDKAKSFVFSYLLSQPENRKYADMVLTWECFDGALTPIEQIFYAAFRLYMEDFSYPISIQTSAPFWWTLDNEIVPQKEVRYNGKKYVLDFEIDFSKKSSEGKHLYPELKNHKYAVELDGFAYHSTKEQMSRDYTRENDLKEMGYSVVRFTGSQVYKNPLSCVDKLVKIIVNDIIKATGE